MSIVTTVPQMDGPVDAQVRMTGADSTTEATTETTLPTLPTLSTIMHQELTRQWGRERDQRRREALLEYARRRNSLFQHKAGEMHRLATRRGAGETGFNVKAPVNVDRRRRILATGQGGRAGNLCENVSVYVTSVIDVCRTHAHARTRSLSLRR